EPGVYQPNFLLQPRPAKGLLERRGDAVALAVAAGTGITLGDGRHVGMGAELALVPTGLTQPLEEPLAAAGVERPLDLPFSDAGRLADEHDSRLRPAAEYRPGH